MTNRLDNYIVEITIYLYVLHRMSTCGTIWTILLMQIFTHVCDIEEPQLHFSRNAKSCGIKKRSICV